MNKIYESKSARRKMLQVNSDLPPFFITPGLLMFEERYLYKATGFKAQLKRIADKAALRGREMGYAKDSADQWKLASRFFNLVWDHKMTLSTPVLANMGSDRGCPVSCSGSLVGDSVESMYDTRKELALLTKEGFGTSVDLSAIRSRGTPISNGGTATGTFMMLDGVVQDMRLVAQGSARRGACAQYLDVEHGDFLEWARRLRRDNDDLNVGWIIRDSFLDRCDSGEEAALEIWKEVCHTALVTGKGFLVKIDEINRHRPEAYVKNDLFVNHSNLCTEITLFNDKDHTFTCVLGSLIIDSWDSITEEDIFYATMFLDCVAEEFIHIAKTLPGLERAARFTEKGRALGLGAAGFHSYLIKKGVPFESLEAAFINNEVFNSIHDASLKASQWMAMVAGEPEWCVGTGLRNTHRTAIAPTKSTALIFGGISEGCSPEPAMVYQQNTSAGEVFRVNPYLQELMKERGVYNHETIVSINKNNGSVQDVSWLSEEEKKVFKTAFEIDMEVNVRLFANRQQYICQGQSMNLFVSEEESEENISKLMKGILKNPNILTSYYINSRAGVKVVKEECDACQ